MAKAIERERERERARKADIRFHSIPASFFPQFANPPDSKQTGRLSLRGEAKKQTDADNFNFGRAHCGLKLGRNLKN